MGEWDRAVLAYESALRHNPSSTKTLHALGKLLLSRDQFSAAVEVFNRLLALNQRGAQCEEVYADLGLCWLAVDDLGKASNFIQRAVECSIKLRSDTIEIEEGGQERDKNEAVNGGNGGVKGSDPCISLTLHSSTLWYALGLYHDRIGNEEAALDAYLAFIESDREESAAEPTVSDRSREVYYRMGLIYRLTGKFKEARQCFDFVRRQLSVRIRPNNPVAQNQVSGPCMAEVQLQLALLDECEGEVIKARQGLEKLLIETSSATHPAAALHRLRHLVPKIRQRLGCLALTLPTVFENDSAALALLLKATEEEPQDSLNWYYLGRLYLQLRQPTKAYDAYQQAVYRDGRNAAFWNSIGLLYFQIGQFRDALDAFTRAVHHAPQTAALWWNLGLLYEACHGIGCEDSREAFQKGYEYCKNAGAALQSKFESKLQQLQTSESPVESGESEPVDISATVEMDAGRFVIRSMAAFPRHQSAASISRFLTFRSHQQQQQQQQLQSVAAAYNQRRQIYPPQYAPPPSNTRNVPGYAPQPPQPAPQQQQLRPMRPPIYRGY